MRRFTAFLRTQADFLRTPAAFIGVAVTGWRMGADGVIPLAIWLSDRMPGALAVLPLLVPFLWLGFWAVIAAFYAVDWWIELQTEARKVEEK